MALENIGGTEATSGISRKTTEYLYWVFTEAPDLAGTTTYVAFVEGQNDKPEGIAASTPAALGEWITAPVVENPDNAAQDALRLLVGPGPGADITLTPGGTTPVTYRVWARIDIGDEQIVRRMGTLTVR
jgi:hypothetical protein